MRQGRVQHADDAGYNSIWALLAARQFLPAERDVRLATIFLGANDSVLEFRGQYVPLEDFKAKLREIYDLIRSVNAKAPPAVVFITCPPVSIPMRKVDVLRRWGEVPMDRDTERTRTYAHAAAEVAAELGAPCCELHDSMEAAALELGNGDRDAGLANFLDDGLHLSPIGYAVRCRHQTRLDAAVPDRTAARRHPRAAARTRAREAAHVARAVGVRAGLVRLSADARSQIDPKHPETAFPPPH